MCMGALVRDLVHTCMLALVRAILHMLVHALVCACDLVLACVCALL